MTDVMPLEHVRLVVVMPIGPGEDPSDTLESVRAYTDPSRAVVLVDDTGSDALAASVAGDPDVHVVPAPAGASGGWGGLWVKIAAGHSHACAHWRFDLLLRMDTDALLIGAGIEDAALRRFAEEPGLGLLGAYRTGPDGSPRDFAPAAATLRAETGWRGWRHPRLRARLRGLLDRATANGYRHGEHALGGAYLQTGAAVRSLASRGLLDMPEMADSHLGEDQVFALLTVAAGFGIGDFSRPGDPMAVRWRGLPASPEDLLAGPALITHSVRFHGDRDEDEIRAVFAAARRAGAPAGG
ncbi:hypothetical protein [Miltoncostaea oceani]|uniref:hypothetical protein n=1 Tax=Miltoncostaea oceani TaxID=2843216 RepID=UPI001C3C873E|nr:hypothetical protein [Miltoncostaea oceani]